MNRRKFIKSIGMIVAIGLSDAVNSFYTKNFKEPDSEKILNLESSFYSNKNSLYKISENEKNEILKNVMWNNGPSKFAGELPNSEDILIIQKEGKRINEVIGLASYYHQNFNGRRTATGALFSDEIPIVAINERLGYQIPCLVEITNLNNGKEVEAIALDHGPYNFNFRGKPIRINGKYEPHPNRLVDVSLKLAKILDFEEKGLEKVKIKYLGKLKI